MKHQVFLFLAFYFFSAYSMNHDISTITKDEIVSRLTLYNNFMEQHRPNRIDTQALRNDIEVIKARDLSDADKKEILAEMKLLPSLLSYDINRITKTQFINDLTDFNYYMKQHHGDSSEVKEFGRFIIALRSVDIHSFEKHKKELVASMEILPNLVYERELS